MSGGRKQGPPCMSCGWDKNTAPKTTCKDKKSHTHDRDAPSIQTTNWDVQWGNQSDDA